jgi:hypothetical protein
MANRYALSDIATGTYTSTDLRTLRKVLYTEIFFMFFVYFVSQVLHAFRYKNSVANRNSVQHSLIPARISTVNENEQTGNIDLTQSVRRMCDPICHGTKKDGIAILPFCLLPTQLGWE